MGNLYKALLSHKSRKFDLQIQQIVSKPAIEHNMWGLVVVSGTPALSVFVFIQGKEPAEDGSGFGIGQVDMAQIPKSRAHVQALEMAITGGDLKNGNPSER